MRHPDDPTGREGRRVAALLCFAAVAPVGYALHRLWFAAGEADPRMIIASAHIGFYWRVATAAWWGLLAAAAGYRFPALADVARWMWAPGVLVAALIATWVP